MASNSLIQVQSFRVIGFRVCAFDGSISERKKSSVPKTENGYYINFFPHENGTTGLLEQLVVHFVTDDSIDLRGDRIPGIEIAVVGQFLIPEAYQNDKSLILFNAAMLLYGLARGQVNALTASLISGPVILPSLNMREELNRWFDRIKKEIKSQKIKTQKKPGSKQSN